MATVSIKGCNKVIFWIVPTAIC